MRRNKNNPTQKCEYCNVELPKEELYWHSIYSYMCPLCYKNYLQIKKEKHSYRKSTKTKEELIAIREKYSKINIDEEINKWISSF